MKTQLTAPTHDWALMIEVIPETKSEADFFRGLFKDREGRPIVVELGQELIVRLQTDPSSLVRVDCGSKQKSL